MLSRNELVNRVVGDQHLGHHVASLRRGKPGYCVRGKRNLMKLQDSVEYRPGIGVGANEYVATICKSLSRYTDIDDMGCSVDGCVIEKYAAEGGMTMCGKRQKKHQNPLRRKNKALRRSTRTDAPLIAVWLGVDDKVGGGNMYTYMGLYKASRWRRRIREGLRYFTVKLTRRACDNDSWTPHEIKFPEESEDDQDDV